MFKVHIQDMNDIVHASDRNYNESYYCKLHMS